jgi:hypothetical protein
VRVFSGIFLLRHPNSSFRLTAAITLDITYGIRVQSLKDPYVELVERAAADACETIAERRLVDIFPFLKHLPWWLPGTGFQKAAAKSRKLARRMLDEPMDATKRDIVRTL